FARTRYPHSSSHGPFGAPGPCSTSKVRSREGPSMALYEDFAPQPTSSAELPDPLPLLRSLTQGALEVLAGVREVEQLARWFTEEAYAALVTRANLSARARSARRVAPTRPVYRILSTRCSAPADGVVE